MAATAEKIEELEIPDGGIGDFVMEDDEREAVYGRKGGKKEDFGDAGIAQFPELAKKMATYGRNEDKYLAHVAEGELVIPHHFLKDEDTKKRIFDMLIEAGFENPADYVVGADGNNVNPTTGLPEFWWLQDVLSDVVSGVKSALSSVVKVIKKVAPIVLPIALAMTPLGPIYGAAMGSGIATLANGGSLQDAFKSALVSGATGAAYAGLGKGTGSFFDKVGDAAANPMARIGETLDGVTSSFSDLIPSTDTVTTTTTALPPEYTPYGQTVPLTPKQLAANVPPPSPPDPSFSDFMVAGNQTPQDIALAQQNASAAAYKSAIAGGINEEGAQKLATTAFEGAAPGMLQKFGPSAIAGTALMGATGMFKVPEEEKLDLIRRNADGTPITGEDLIAADPGAYLIKDLGSMRLDEKTGKYVEVPKSFFQTQYQMEYPMYQAPEMPYQAAADGGPIFPRRNGGIAPTEGVQGQDSVRAMLMPGEFVMTTDAVRGMGNGDLNNGIKSMYSVMRNLESRGRKTA